MEVFGIHYHGHKAPFESAPPWAVELRLMLGLILKREERLMSAAQDLNNAVSSLAIGFVALDTAVQAELVALAAAQASGDQAAMTQATANISAITSKMAADAAALTASLPAATTIDPPAPAPAPSVQPTADIPAIAPVTVTDPSATPPAAA